MFLAVGASLLHYIDFPADIMSASMRNILSGLILVALSLPALANNSDNGFLGRWDFDVASASSVGANWLSVTQKGPTDYEIWFQPTGGHVYQVKDYKLTGDRLVLHSAPTIPGS